MPGPHTTLLLNLGPLLIGGVINTFLFGVFTLQVYYYYHAFPNDPRVLRYAIGFLVIFGIVETIFSIEMMWNFLVRNWGNFPALLVPGWGFCLIPIMDGWTALIVQAFFAWRISRLTGSNILAGLVFLLSVVQTAGASTASILCLHLNDVLKIHTFKPAVITWLSTSSACDVLISSILIFTLAQSKTGFDWTDDIITKLIRSTIETGVATTSFQIAELVTYLTMQDNNVHALFATPLGKLYSNSMLASLNSRASGFFGPASGAVSSSQGDGRTGNMSMPGGGYADQSNYGPSVHNGQGGYQQGGYQQGGYQDQNQGGYNGNGGYGQNRYQGEPQFEGASSVAVRRSEDRTNLPMNAAPPGQNFSYKDQYQYPNNPSNHRF